MSLPTPHRVGEGEEQVGGRGSLGGGGLAGARDSLGPLVHSSLSPRLSPSPCGVRQTEAGNRGVHNADKASASRGAPHLKLVTYLSSTSVTSAVLSRAEMGREPRKLVLPYAPGAETGT